jgi:hypothetical protein
MRMRTLAAPLLVLTLTVPSLTPAQLKFSPDSRLGDSTYVANRIRTISDQDLFSSLDPRIKELSRVFDSWRAGNSRQAYSAWVAYWNAKTQPHYITQSYKLLIDTDLLKEYDPYREYIARNPADRDTIFARAGGILRNVFRPWGDYVVSFGDIVDFNRDIGQSGKYGFHYWWWARPLNSAFVLGGDKRYLEKFEELFNRWYEQRNFITRGFRDLDVVFYELGIGARNRVFVEYYLLPQTTRSLQTHERMLKNALASGRWLSELERWEGYRAGNWQIVGASTLVQIALTFPEFKESAEWLAIGLKRLDEHLASDFFDDGGHSERAPRNYTLLTYLSYRNTYFLLTQHKKEAQFAAHIRESLGKTVDWWISMLTPTGEIPALNDSHRGQFPVEILKDAALFFDKPDVAGVLRSLFGDASAGYGSPPSFTSRHMPSSGFTVMRSDWTRDALFMNITYGPGAGFHTHADLLSFELYAYGKALAVDAGIGLTYDDSLYLPWYQSTKAHNTVVVNGLSMKRGKARGEDVRWMAIPSLEYFSASHRGYDSLGVHHRRTVVFVKPRYWFVLDDLQLSAGLDTLSWYCHSPTSLQAFSGGFRSAGSPGLLILPPEDGLTVTKGKGMAASTDDMTPGKVQEINWIRFNRVGEAGDKVQFPVLLYPYSNVPAEVTVARESANRYRIASGTFTDILWFAGGAGSEERIETDADFVMIHKAGGSTDVSVLHATYVRYRGKTLWRSGEATSTDGIVLPD